MADIGSILDVYPLGRCVGNTLKGVGCNSPIASHNCDNAEVLLRSLRRIPLQNITNESLKTLSTFILCKRDHNIGPLGQQDRMVSVWSQRIRRAIRALPMTPVSPQDIPRVPATPSNVWDPATLLYGNMGESSFNCVVITPQSSRCTNPITDTNRAAAHRLLAELKNMGHDADLNDKLWQLADLVMCYCDNCRFTSSDKARVVEKWKREIVAFRDRLARHQAGRYLASPQQSRETSPAAEAPATPTRPQGLRSGRASETRANITRTTTNQGYPATPPSSPLSGPVVPARRGTGIDNGRQHTAASNASHINIAGQPGVSRPGPETTSSGREQQSSTSTSSLSTISETINFPSVPDTEPRREPRRSRRSRQEQQQTTSSSSSSSTTSEIRNLPSVPDTGPRREPPPLLAEQPVLASSTPQRPRQVASNPTPPETPAAPVQTPPETPSNHTRENNQAEPEPSAAESQIATAAAQPPVCGDRDLHRSRRHHLPDQCAICLEEMRPAEILVWCKSQCGQNMHRQCWVPWRDQLRGSRRVVRCPVCRQPWDFTACPCDDEKPLADPPSDVVGTCEACKTSCLGVHPLTYPDLLSDIWMGLPAAAQANLLWGPFPPRRPAHRGHD